LEPPVYAGSVLRVGITPFNKPEPKIGSLVPEYGQCYTLANSDHILGTGGPGPVWYGFGYPDRSVLQVCQLEESCIAGGPINDTSEWRLRDTGRRAPLATWVGNLDGFLGPELRAESFRAVQIRCIEDLCWVCV
jgi:hypothetical protein